MLSEWVAERQGRGSSGQMVPGSTESSWGNKWMFVMSKGRGGKTLKAARGHRPGVSEG